jgi:hypothetical protein
MTTRTSEIQQRRTAFVPVCGAHGHDLSDKNVMVARVVLGKDGGSSHISVPAISGLRAGDCAQSTPAHFGPPERAQPGDMCSCASVKTFKEHGPPGRTRGQLVEDFITQKETSGGALDTLYKAWHVNPAGSSPTSPPLTVMPDA